MIAFCYCSIFVKDNFTVFDESLSKTLHDALKDMKKSRFIQHKCHEVGYQEDRCLAALYSVYITKVQSLAASLQSFYFGRIETASFGMKEALQVYAG